MVPAPGLEPGWPKRPRDFKSLASTNSAKRANPVRRRAIDRRTILNLGLRGNRDDARPARPPAASAGQCPYNADQINQIEYLNGI